MASSLSVILVTGSYDHEIRFWEAWSGICSRTITRGGESGASTRVRLGRAREANQPAAASQQARDITRVRMRIPRRLLRMLSLSSQQALSRGRHTQESQNIRDRRQLIHSRARVTSVH